MHSRVAVTHANTSPPARTSWPHRIEQQRKAQTYCTPIGRSSVSLSVAAAVAPVLLPSTPAPWPPGPPPIATSPAAPGKTRYQDKDPVRPSKCPYLFGNRVSFGDRSKPALWTDTYPARVRTQRTSTSGITCTPAGKKNLLVAGVRARAFGTVLHNYVHRFFDT